jgi:hypothetical protein
MITIVAVTPKKSKFKTGSGAASSVAAPSPAKRRTTTLPETRTLEANLVGLAMTGKLAKAGRRAVASQVDRGLPVTFKRGQKVIKVHPDGREEVLATLDRPTYTLPKGVRVIR